MGGGVGCPQRVDSALTMHFSQTGAGGGRGGAAPSLSALLPLGRGCFSLDAVALIKDFSGFCRRYSYSVHQDLFIERVVPRGAKHANVLSVDTLTASLRVHGRGFVASAVNHAYAYLSQRFTSVSAFLQDDYVRSALSKERREARAAVNGGGRYPIARAEALANGPLGPALARFRVLLSELGNALGFVRLLRSAGWESGAEEVAFLPPEVWEGGVHALGGAPTDAPPLRLLHDALSNALSAGGGGGRATPPPTTSGC